MAIAGAVALERPGKIHDARGGGGLEHSDERWDRGGCARADFADQVYLLERLDLFFDGHFGARSQTVSQ